MSASLVEVGKGGFGCLYLSYNYINIAIMPPAQQCWSSRGKSLFRQERSEILALYRRESRRFRQRKLLLFRSEEHTSELQSLMRISYAVFCLKKKNQKIHEYK